MNFKKHHKKIGDKGFTLIEIMVSLSIFMVIILISSGSILSVFDVNRKSNNLQSVMDNLNLTMEAMTRTIRFGTAYHCDVTVTPVALPRDCTSGANSMSVLDSTGRQVSYKLNGTRISRSVDGGPEFFLTSPDMIIETLTFRVFGADDFSSGDISQPEAVIVVSGYAGVKPTSKTTFTLQTTVSQRVFDSE